MSWPREFVVDGLVSSVEELNRWTDQLKDVEHPRARTLWTMPVLEAISPGKPTMIFSPIPDMNGTLSPCTSRRRDDFECLLTSDYGNYAAVRPFRRLSSARGEF
jgi:hypothetical protein